MQRVEKSTFIGAQINHRAAKVLSPFQDFINATTPRQSQHAFISTLPFKHTVKIYNHCITSSTAVHERESCLFFFILGKISIYLFMVKKFLNEISLIFD